MKCFPKNRVYFTVIATIISTSCGEDYESQLAIKVKNLNLDYGEKMSSVEHGARQERSGPQLLKMLLSTKCTTGKPIKVDPAYVPESGDGSGSDENNLISNRDENKSDKDSVEDVAESKKPYLAPSSTDNPYYVDDER